MKVAKTVYPPVTIKSYDEWSMWIFGLYSKSIEKSKKDWSNNIYIPKK